MIETLIFEFTNYISVYSTLKNVLYSVLRMFESQVFPENSKPPERMVISTSLSTLLSHDDFINGKNTFILTMSCENIDTLSEKENKMKPC